MSQGVYSLQKSPATVGKVVCVQQRGTVLLHAQGAKLHVDRTDYSIRMCVRYELEMLAKFTQQEDAILEMKKTG